MTWDVSQLNDSDLSAAQVIAEELKRRGVDRDSILGSHIQNLYNKLNKTKGSACIVSEVIEHPLQTQIMNDEVLAVIIETRQHRNLEFVVCQIAKNLGVNIQIFYGKSNKDFILKSAIGKLIEKGQVTLNELDVNSLSASDYNAMLLSQGFWNALKGRNKILIFQTDSILCQNSSYHLGDFKSFDYIGSEWSRVRPVGVKIEGGSGGFSLRDWKKIKECLSRFPSRDWPGGEDGYFAFHLDLMGAKVGRSPDCAKFSSQGKFNCKSFACHSIHLMNDADLGRFLKYAPEARSILP
jgi:hypothetical protein